MTKVKRCSWRTFTKDEVARFKRYGQIIDGVTYKEELASMHGMRFFLIDEGQSMAQFVKARAAIYIKHDVVGAILLCRIKGD